MSEAPSMDQILDDKPVEAPAVDKPVEAPPTEAKPELERPLSKKAAHLEKEQLAQGLVRDPETGQFRAKEPEVKPEVKEAPKEATKAEVKPAAPQQDMTDKERAFLRAAEEERRKRQSLERELQEARAKAPQPPTEAAKTFWDDPEGWMSRQQEQQRQEALKQRLGVAEMLARSKYTDFDEKVGTFTEMAKTTPGLIQAWLASPDPAEYAYRAGKNHMDIQAAGSIDQLKANIEKELRLKIEAELKEKSKTQAEALAKERAALPGSLSDARSTGVNKPVWGGPPSMDDILGRK